MSHKRPRALYESDLPHSRQQHEQQHESPYVFYGAALPPLDSSTRDDGSYVPVWKQEVTDEQGRKRLHGAFTGGFSAGYFNTVGSKEGWTPSTFVSSRSNRKSKQKSAEGTGPTDGQNGAAAQRPEDYMDEEDLADRAASQRLQTASNFSGLGSTESELAERGVGATLMDVFKTSGGDTMGVRLLKRMGWREGQGVGARVWRKARADDGDPKDPGEGDEGDRMHLFAPQNPGMVRFVRKHDSKGLGYEGESGLNGSSTARGPSKDDDEDDEDEGNGTFGTGDTSRASTRPRKETSRRGAFGVGILNDTGSDDEDPYEIGPRISYNRVVGGKQKPTKKNKLLKNGRVAAGPGAANPLLGANKPVFISKSKVGNTSQRKNGFRKCHDGRLPLEGFLLATDDDLPSSVVNQDGRYLAPEIPKDWKSSRQPKSDSPVGPSGDYQSVADAAKASKMDPKSRAALLGEAELPGKSVFDFLSPAARDRIASASGKADLPTARGEAAPKAFSMTDEEKRKELWHVVPTLGKDVALKALGRGVGGWMPYTEDETKRARYRAFLEGQAGLRSGDQLPERGPGMSKDEWANELREFAHAAQIFKPMTGMMASRFTSSSAQPGLAPDAPESETDTESLLRKGAAFKRPEDPAIEAARAGMFGPMTRSIGQFFPTRLLCKRFNVKPPAHVQVDPEKEPGGSPAGGAAPPPPASGAAGARFQSGGYQTNSAAMPTKTLQLVSSSAMEDMVRQSADSRATGETGGSQGTTGTSEQTKAVPPPPQKTVVNVERNEALEGERPGEAVFKAIFGSDDEDEDE